MNIVLFKSNIKNYWLLIVAAIGVLLMYGTISVTMFDPDLADSMTSMFDSFPEGMMKAFGFDEMGTTLLEFVESFMYGFIIVVFSAIFLGLIAHGLIGKHTDKGSMVYLLATPNKRSKIVLTQGIFLMAALTFIFGIYVIAMLITSHLAFPGLLNVINFLKLNLVTYLCIAFVSSLAFLFSCYFNESRYSLGAGIGLPVFFVIIGLLKGLSSKLDWLGFLSPYSLINGKEIYTSSSYLLTSSTLLFLGTIGVFTLATLIFNKKNFII